MPGSSGITATCGALVLTSLLVGYGLGRLSATGARTRLSTTTTQVIRPSTATESKRDSTPSSDDDEGDDDANLLKVSAGLLDQCKLVLCVRTDLNMSSGKIAAQCSHATLACYKSLVKSNSTLVKHWERTGQAKIALKCSSEDELLLLQAKAQSLNLCARTIADAGRTEVDPGTITVLGIGPGPVPLINQDDSKSKQGIQIDKEFA